MTRRHLIPAISILLLSGTAQAGTLDFTLELQHHELEVKQKGIPRKLKYDIFGIRYGESNYQPFQLDLLLGPMDATEEETPASSGVAFSGYQLGFEFTATALAQKPVNGALSLGYRYHDVDGSNGSQTSKLTWYESRARLTLNWQIAERYRLYGCASYLNVDGDMVASGTITATESFSTRVKNGRCAGIRYGTPWMGFTGVEWYSGDHDGFNIYFGRRFGE